MPLKVRINGRTGKPISLKMQQSDAIQKIIYEKPGRTISEILDRVTELFPGLEITEKRVADHVRFGQSTSTTQRALVEVCGEWSSVSGHRHSATLAIMSARIARSVRHYCAGQLSTMRLSGNWRKLQPSIHFSQFSTRKLGTRSKSRAFADKTVASFASAMLAIFRSCMPIRTGWIRRLLNLAAQSSSKRRMSQA
jgi:hypothetical protein